MLLPLVVGWLMLLAIVADVKATFYICVNPQMLFWQMLLPIFRLMFFAILVDVITTIV